MRSLRLHLRGYQLFGAKYLIAQRRCVLGDEMGLGKTVQAMAAMTHLHEMVARGFDRLTLKANIG